MASRVGKVRETLVSLSANSFVLICGSICCLHMDTPVVTKDPWASQCFLSRKCSSAKHCLSNDKHTGSYFFKCSFSTDTVFQPSFS